MTKGVKPAVSTLPWKAIMKIAVLKAEVENGKHKDNQPWYDFVDHKQNLDSLARHVGEYCSGKRRDEESGLPVIAHVALRALMQLELELRPVELERKKPVEPIEVTIGRLRGRCEDKDDK